MDASSARAKLFGSRRRVAVVGVVVCALAVGAVLAGVVGAPTVTGVENAFGPVDDSTTVVESDLHVRNPNPVGVSLGGLTVDYAAEMNGIEMATGTKRGVAVDAGTSTLPFRTTMRNERIPRWWVSHIRNDEHTTLTVAADVHSSLVGASLAAPQVERDVDTDLVSAFNSTETRPLNAGAEPVVDDPVVYLNRTTATWGTVTDERTEIEMTFTVYNPKPYPVAVSTIGYDIGMNGVSVGSGETNRTYTIPPKTTRTVDATTVIRNDRLDEWWVTHLERNQVTELRVSLFLEFDLSAGPAQLTSVRVPLDDLTRTVETDIFGTKADKADGTADDGGATGSTATEAATETPGEGESTATDGTSTPADGGLLDAGDDTASETPTATETPTPTPTPAPDDTPTDGGLL